MHSRGVTNVVLMMGVALAMAILLIGGVSVVNKFVQAQAQSSPKFVAVELAALINTVQAAPETVTFDYYTEVKQDGYPVIGSLEIDDDANKLCVSPHSENEIFSAIVDQAAIGAGFGTVGYTQNRVRSAVSAKATRQAAADNALFGDFAKLGLSDKMLYTIGADSSKKGQAARQFLEGEPIKYSQIKLFSEAELKELRQVEKKISKSPDMKYALTAADKNIEVRSKGLLARIKNKLSFSKESKLSKFGQRFEAWAARNGENPSVFKRVGGTISKSTKKIGGAGGIVVAGVFSTLTYFMTGGDQTATMLTFVQMTIMNYMPKLIGWIITKTASRFGWRLVTWVPVNVAQATAYKLTGEACKDDPEPVSKAITCAAAAVAKIAEVITNVAFTTYNAIAIDLTFWQIHNAASHQVSVERDSIACENFVAPKKVLLTPPNCVPEVKYGKTFDSYKDLGASTFWATAEGLWVATGWAASTAYVPSAGIIPQIQAYGALAAGIVPAYVSLAYTVAKDPTGLIPQSGCYSSCDTTYMRQDCPNWFLSAQGLSSVGSKIGGYGFEVLLNGGPVCAGLALTGMAGTLCDAARVTTALAIFLTGPSEIFNFFLHGDEVGLTKTDIKSKSAPEFPDLKNEFADNTGYWYAEFPYVIELTKVYTGDETTPLAQRNPPLIIRKV